MNIFRYHFYVVISFRYRIVTFAYGRIVQLSGSPVTLVILYVVGKLRWEKMGILLVISGSRLVLLVFRLHG